MKELQEVIDKVEVKKELEDQKLIAIEQYKEISTSRRHYSNLRFALFPVYFAIQYGLIQLVISSNSKSEEILPLFVLSLCGLLITYVFWTIESRIGMYYKMLEATGHDVEEMLGLEQKVMAKWGKKHFLNNTKLAIGTTYILFAIYWILLTIMHYI
nr:hypothetical protein [Lysinibacillus timonensis]